MLKLKKKGQIVSLFKKRHFSFLSLLSLSTKNKELLVPHSLSTISGKPFLQRATTIFAGNFLQAVLSELAHSLTTISGELSHTKREQSHVLMLIYESCLNKD